MTDERMTISKRAFVVLVVVIFLAVGVALAAGGLALRLFGEVQANRTKTNVLICQRFNETARGLQGFVAEVAPDLEGRARKRFAVTPDCREYARELVHPRPRSR
jgi:hypothetical protein